VSRKGLLLEADFCPGKKAQKQKDKKSACRGERKKIFKTTT